MLKNGQQNWSKMYPPPQKKNRKCNPPPGGGGGAVENPPVREGIYTPPHPPSWDAQKIVSHQAGGAPPLPPLPSRE